MKISSICASALFLLSACSPRAAVIADYDVIPLPMSVELDTVAPGFVFSPSTKIVVESADSAMATNARLLAGYLKELVGVDPAITDKASDNAIVLSANLPSESPDAYELIVNDKLITINGASPAGTFYGIQTLRKSIPQAGNYNVRFPAAEIADAPRFAYRGALFDSARHFFPADSVKTVIDMLAMHNINRLHWHLTDDQGWRIEIDKYPKLIEKGSMRTGTAVGVGTDDSSDSIPYGGYYTKDQLRDIVKYAADRHIIIIPEIDLPGHMQGALAAYPEMGCTGGPYEVWKRWGISEDVLCAGNDSIYTFINDVLDEVMEIFPSEYIHIGGDECPKVLWKECPKCQAKIKALGLRSDSHSTAEQKLQNVVMESAVKHLTEHGRKVIGWDEILEGGIVEDLTIMSWRGEEGGRTAAKAGCDAIMSPYEYLYFDFVQADREHEPQGANWGDPTPLEKVYSYEPIPVEFTPEEAAHIIGVQANTWTEYIPTLSHAQYMMLPRLAATAEIQWRQPARDYADFMRRLPQLLRLYRASGYNYHPTPAAEPTAESTSAPTAQQAPAAK